MCEQKHHYKYHLNKLFSVFFLKKLRCCVLLVIYVSLFISCGWNAVLTNQLPGPHQFFYIIMYKDIIFVIFFYVVVVCSL